MRQNFETQQDGSLAVTVSSFGFARGLPPLADLVFDMRYLDNPHWEPGLREQTGLAVSIAEDSLNCVALGTGKALEFESRLRHAIDYDS